MAIKADDYVWITKWHEDYQPDPHPQVGDIYSGLRAPAGSRAKDVTSPCQYWVKGMPGICSHFSENKCSAEPDDKGKYPTGYNNGNCDYLGRRNWCSQYEIGVENLEEYICIAPDMFRTGLGKHDTSITTHLVLIPYPKSEILGYNEDEDGVGRCDGFGMGRGKDGEGVTNPEEMYEKPVVCKHYKPWIMGFGAIKPRPVGTAVLTGKNIYDGSSSDPLTDMGRHLPYSFRVLNMRAFYQKCAYWKQEYGTFFEIDYSGGYATIELPVDPLTECTCEDNKSTPYKTIIDTWPEHASDTLTNVLTEDGGIVCNGANSECPCYTGKWYYCIADNMQDGMRITAEQILELRFWVAIWQTKEAYDSIFAEKSGPSGLTTSDIFTFDRWEKLGVTVEDSVMEGKRIFQCFPIPYNKRIFDPKIYLTKKNIIYPKININTGTSESTNSPFPTLIRAVDDVSLVPLLDVIYPYACKNPWDVELCDPTPDSEELMEVASCKMELPSTAVFGYTIKNKKVYVLNTNETGGRVFFERFKKKPLSLFPDEERKDLNIRIESLIDSTLENTELSKYIVFGVANDYGYFGIGPLPIKYNVVTSIAVICRIDATGDSEYEVVIRDIKSKFYGGVILQDSFEFKRGENGLEFLPSSFRPGATLKGRACSFCGEVGNSQSDTHSLFPVYSLHRYGVMQDTIEYSYCVNEYIKKNQIIKRWVRVGPTGYIWAEINNIDISYLFDFEVISAQISPIGAGIGMICGEIGDSDMGGIKLKVVFPKPGDPDVIKRRHILPNCVLLKAPSPQGFFNEDWNLSLDYKYKILESSKANEDSGAKVVWPDNLDKEGSPNKFVAPPFTFYQESVRKDKFELKNIRTGTTAIMLYIGDKEGRVQAATATKMLLDVVTTRCRGVDIFYNYRADAQKYDLIPNTGFFTWKGGDRFAGNCVHSNTPQCGDHETSAMEGTPGYQPGSVGGMGPAWFPFSNCQTYDYYNFCQGPSVCNFPIEGGEGGGAVFAGYRNDYRYRMADQYRAYTGQGCSQWAATCCNGWAYSYSVAGASQFVGYGNIKTSVILWWYKENGWALPPFGNAGREITERWLSQDFYGFWDLSGIKPIPRTEYMPLVFDNETLFTSFDAFEERDEHNYFHTTCMLNYMMSPVIEEKITVTYENTYSNASVSRVRFDDAFRIINHAWCMYPPPVYEGPSGHTSVRRYSFKEAEVNDKETKTSPTGHVYDELIPANKDVAWAWREYWKDIERALPDARGIVRVLDFVIYNKPDYYVDFVKKEHRLITDEGETKIFFKAPLAKNTGKGAAGYSYPEISIENGPPRKFNIIYDDYNDEQVEWKDEGGDGTDGSSGGGDLGVEGGGGEFGGGGASGSWDDSGDGSVYENTMGGDWFHDSNTIFDASASAEKEDDRKIILDIDAWGEECIWYNRGLIANIPRNRLGYLPYRLAEQPITTYKVEPRPDASSEYYDVWYNNGKTATSTSDVIFTCIREDCIFEVTINGRIGVKAGGKYSAEAGIYCRPAVTISECAMDDEPSEEHPTPTILYTDRGESGDKTSEKGMYYKYLKSYKKTIRLSRLPKRVLYRSPMFRVKFTLFPGQHLMLQSESGVGLWPGKYVDKIEIIKVWERKYITSIGDFGDKNPDGKDSYDLRSYHRDLKNAGQYFPAGINSTSKDSIIMKSKITMVGANEQTQEDEELDISISNLKEIEAKEQQRLYEDAYMMDDYDEMTYDLTIPPNVQQFFKTNNMGLHLHGFSGSCQFTSEKLSWEKHNLVKEFQQEGTFWQAGGHYYVWSSKIEEVCCWRIGPIETLYTVDFVHVNHAGFSYVIDPGHAYYGWARFWYYTFKLAQAERHGENVTAHQADLMTGSTLVGIDEVYH